MSVRVEVSSSMLTWARERARIAYDDLLGRFPHLPEWESGSLHPTLRQLEGYARATHVAFGLLLLSEPPDEPLPIPDFRTIADSPIGRPSADLLDTIYICEERQDWYRDFARINREDRVPFVGMLSVASPVEAAAETIRSTVGFDLPSRAQFPSWTAALSGLADQVEESGVLVMTNGIVGSNTHRRLDPQEFRGFSLVDDLAPIIFVNGADTKAAQIFTLAHEVAHIWLGSSGLDDAVLDGATGNETERWCNRVAAELLVPLAALREAYNDRVVLTEELDRLARLFKVSTLVVLRRIHDAGRLSWDEFRHAYAEELHRVQALMERDGSGGNFYNTTPIRASKRFSRALISSTLEGQTLYRDAARLLGFKSLSTLGKLGEHLGVA
ncbi:MAG: hypothetical protein JWO62_2283 [Acidimicrobiaceae bacterium]|nr:hypothetical protein [Acidimicrobiaceae bacterium]